MTIEIGRRYRFTWEGGHIDGEVAAADGTSVLINRSTMALAAGVHTFHTQIFLSDYITVTPLPDPAVALAGALVADALERAVSGYGYETIHDAVWSIIAAIRPPAGAR